MRYLDKFRVIESNGTPLAGLPPSIEVETFSRQIGLNEDEAEKFTHLWLESRPHFLIHHFRFRTPHPIMGVFFFGDIVCINQLQGVPPLIKAFIALHESRHADQWSRGIFEEKYFKPVVEERREDFLEGYIELESDANTWALETLRGGGFEDFVEKRRHHLRQNELMGTQVYNMMLRDIKMTRSASMADLLSSQIF